MKGTGVGVGLPIVPISAGVCVVDLSRPLRYVIMWLWDVPPYLPPDSRARDPRDLGEVGRQRWDDKVDGNRVNAELRNLPSPPLLPQSLELRTTLLCRERRHAFDSPKHIVGNGLITRELRLFSRNEFAMLLRYNGFCMKIAQEVSRLLEGCILQNILRMSLTILLLYALCNNYIIIIYT